MKVHKILSLALALALCLGLVPMAQAVDLDYEALEARGIILYGEHTFREGLMPVLVNDEWNYINENLEVVDLNRGRFANVFPFYEGLAAVIDNQNFLVGYIDKTGKVVIPCQYGAFDQMGMIYVGRFHNGVVTVLKENYSGERDPLTWFYSPGQWEVAKLDKTGKALTGYTTVEGLDPNLYLVSDAGNTVEPSIAYATPQTVLVDGKPVEFQCYALKDENGNLTNYIKLRDLAMLLNGTAAQFQVGWDGSVTITAKTAYTANGSELNTPFSGDRAYTLSDAVTKVNGAVAALDAFVLTDDAGGGYTYYKLRDLGKALGFNVDWSKETGVFIETDKPYAD